MQIALFSFSGSHIMLMPLCKYSICCHTHTHTDSLQKPHAGCCAQVNRRELVFLFGDVLYRLIKTAFQTLARCSPLTCIA